MKPLHAARLALAAGAALAVGSTALAGDGIAMLGQSFQILVVGMIVVIATLALLQGLCHVNRVVSRLLNQKLRLDPMNQERDNRPAKPAPAAPAAQDTPAESEDQLIAVLTAAAAAALGTQDIKVLSYAPAGDDDLELIAVLTAAAMAVLDAPVRVVGFQPASTEYEKFTNWILHGRQGQFLPSRVR